MQNMMPRGLEYNGENRDQDMFDFVLGEESDNFSFQSSSHATGVKDEDSVKLFIGQIPKDMDEDALRPYFAEYGPIYELTVIRDKTTRIHRGCAFLTYSHKGSAQMAVENLHDKIKLPNAVNALQVRPAESQAERENKLFIGMLPKTINEEDLERIFSQYGELREVHVIRGTDGHSKGCAFIKFMDRDAAMVAIDCMHDTIPEGSTRPLVVKFADNKKASKGKGSMSPPDTPSSSGMPMLMPGLLSPGQSMSPEYWSMQQQPQHTHGQQTPNSSHSQYPYNVAGSQSAAVNVGQNSPQQQMMSMPYIAYPNPSGTPSYVYYQSPVGMYPPPYAPNSPGYGGAGNQSEGFSQVQRQGGAMSSQYRQQSQQHQSSAGGSMPSEGGGGGSGGPRSAGGMQSPNSMPMLGQIPIPMHAQVQSHANSRPPEGPSGANLFIYHLPRDLTDADLATLFASFGNVISAKVYVDKKTAESKGFGFVSYDSVSSAEEAINTMNGFQIGSKRLKVQHKRSGPGPGGFDIMGMGGGGGGPPMMGGAERHGHHLQGSSPGHLPTHSHGGMNMGVPSGGQYQMMSSLGMSVPDYGQVGVGSYGMPQGLYPDGKSGMTMQYMSGPAGRGQHQQQLGLEEQFMNMGLGNGAPGGAGPNSAGGPGGGAQDPPRRLTVGGNVYGGPHGAMSSSLQQQASSYQQPSSSSSQQHQQQQQQDIRFRGL